MEDIEDTQDLDRYALPYVSPLNLEFFSLVMKVLNLLWKKGTVQIMIYLTQYMLTSQDIKSKR